MSWQRIDENTYIDDTLVTCAEYQLFIDEMREQGKYYQPDHWTSYQFPKGYAHEPILGVRRHDAYSFCEWLTSREGATWNFRMPTQKEVDEYHVKIQTKALIGYWLLGFQHRKEVLFSWVNLIPTDARLLDFDMINRHTIEIITAKYPELNIDDIFYRSRNRPLDLRADALTYGYWRYYQEGNPQVDAFESQLDAYLIRDIQFRQQKDISISNILDSALSIQHKTSLYFQEILLDEWSDLLTLQERIAGRSPAFEGIRLVKERIR
jgi:hypothetical protein